MIKTLDLIAAYLLPFFEHKGTVHKKIRMGKYTMVMKDKYLWKLSFITNSSKQI
jgi:hypothetical protein